MRIRESIRKFTYGDVDAFTWFCTAIAIFFVVKQSCSSGRIELLLLSVKANVLSEKFERKKWASPEL